MSLLSCTISLKTQVRGMAVDCLLSESADRKLKLNAACFVWSGILVIVAQKQMRANRMELSPRNAFSQDNKFARIDVNAVCGFKWRENCICFEYMYSASFDSCMAIWLLRYILHVCTSDLTNGN